MFFEVSFDVDHRYLNYVKGGWVMTYEVGTCYVVLRKDREKNQLGPRTQQLRVQDPVKVPQKFTSQKTHTNTQCAQQTMDVYRKLPTTIVQTKDT